MPIELHRAYLDEIKERYRNGAKKQKTKILDEFCAVCGYERKYATRILNGSRQSRRRRPGPQSRYLEALPALRELWDLMGQICSKKMRAAMPLWLPFYGASDRINKILLAISPSTIDRLLRAHRAPLRKGMSSTRPSSWVKSKIPLKLLDGEAKVPGYMEVDTVVHCGNSMAGEYANSLTMTDLYSGWTELRASWTKESSRIVEQARKAEERLPFDLVGVASDNGTEFLNSEFYAWLRDRDAPINFVRRRPYKKNDNAHVEQKNWTHVRQLFGYERFDSPELAPVMNEIYQAYWCPLWNLFTPVMKLKAKERVGGSVKKHYDDPKTPAQRLLECPLVPRESKAKIMAMMAGKNPIDLKRRLDAKLKEFFRLVDERKRRSSGS